MWAVVAWLAIGGIYCLVAPRSYRSTAQLYIVQAAGVDPQRADEDFNTQTQLISSTPVLALAVTEDGVKDLDTLRGVADPVEFLRNRISADVEAGRKLIDVSFEGRNALDAARIVNAVAQAYITFQTQIHHSASSQALDELDKEKARDEDAIAATNQKFAALRNMYGQDAFESTPNNPIVQQETALSNALTAARLEEVTAQAAYEQAVALVGNDQTKLQQIEMPDNPGDMVAASPQQLAELRTQIFQLGQQLKSLERNYLPDHPAVKQVSARLDQLTITYIRAERQRWHTAQSQREALQASFDQAHKLALVQASRAEEFQRDTSELARIEKDLDVVENRINEISVNQDAGILNIQVTQPAVATDTPSRPVKIEVLGISLLAGLLTGFGLVLGRERVAQGIGPMGRLSAELGSPVLGVLPAITGSGTLATRALRTHLEPNGNIAEAARSIAHVLAESGLDEDGGRTLLVAGMNPSDGKTTVATNLALAMAQSGMKVLLVDASNRSPRLHNIFNLNNSFGLFDVLSGRTDDNPAIHTTNIEHLDVLPCGNAGSNAIELLNNETLVDVLGELSDRYDRVVVDSTSLARGVEGRILAANCSAAILVTAARPTARRHIAQGLRLLRSVGANVLGLVINEPGTTEAVGVAGMGTTSRLGEAVSGKPRAFRPVLAMEENE
jgi:polysaccharide biosynthesis transport protein